MKKLMIKFSVALVLMTGVTACDDFLDQTVNGQLDEGSFYKTDTDALQAVTAAYDMLGAEYNNAWASLYMLKTLPSDESNAGGANNGDQPGYQALDDFNIGSLNDKVTTTWSNLYTTIYRANKIIQYTTPDSPIRERVVGEAKALRAYCYFELVTLWGDVPLMLNDVAPSEFSSIKRAPKADVWAQIEADLADAIEVLPLKSDYDAADKYRFSKGAAQALLGKAHVYQEEWPQAVAVFEDVIGSGEYDLENSVQAVFDINNEFGKESLFELSFVNTEKYDWGNFVWGGKPESNIHIQLMGPRGDYYVKAPGDSLIGGWGMNVAKEKMYNAFVNAGDVKRRRVTIMSKAELVDAGGDWTNDNAWDVEGYWQRKYGSFDNQTGGPVGELNYGTNFKLIRYADVLLLAAEANYRNSDEDAARTYLNMVRERPGTDLAPVSATGDDLFDAIVLERQLELAFEGHRYVDLVRWGLADQELGDLGFVVGTHEVMPIPYTDATSYGLEQNNGY